MNFFSITDADLPPITPPDDTTVAAPQPAAPAAVEKTAATTARRRADTNESSVAGGLLWLGAFAVALAIMHFLIPRIAENVQYSMTRGRLQAEYEIASQQLDLPDTSLHNLSHAYQLVSQRVGPSVVHIDVTTQEEEKPEAGKSGLFHSLPFRFEGQGSGVLMDSEGYILTNHHVIKGASEITVKLADGRQVIGSIVGIDQDTDLALLKIQADKLVAANWGDSERLDMGALVWAVGSPFGLQHSITFGILSGKHRGGSAGTPYQDFLQTDAAVNPGNSGGPLVDSHGRVVGINTAIIGDAYQGISFAIPSRVARDVYQRLKTSGRVSRGWLGVAPDDMTARRAEALGSAAGRGVFIAAVVDSPDLPSPAGKAGIREGDVLLDWNGSQVNSPIDLIRLVGETAVGDAADVTVLRDGSELTLSVTIAERPAS